MTVLKHLIEKTETTLKRCAHSYRAEELQGENGNLAKKPFYIECLGCEMDHWAHCNDYISLEELIQFYRMFRDSAQDKRE